ncbi:hypothetical protein HOD61_00485 [archaeon]|jgi:hypothetical protein|nr:hypothetical protein [archaeon]
MNKRGQFYIITVLIIAMATFAITAESNTIKKSKLFEDFSPVSENYVKESTKAINLAIKNEEVDSIDTNLENFTKSFLNYAKQRDPSIELVYVFKDGDDIIVKNYLTSSNVNYHNTTIFPAGEEVLQAITLEVGGKEFSHQTPVSVEDMGKTWYTYNGAGTVQEMNLSVGGIAHNFDLASGPDFKVIIRSATNSQEITLGDGTEEWVPKSKERGGLLGKVFEVVQQFITK